MKCLAQLEDEPVQCVATSPPYWGLRDYGTNGQIGLESTPDEYISKMVQVFREVKRVLRRDGTLWLNIGDSYANSTPGSGGKCVLVGSGRAMTDARYHDIKRDVSSLKPKDLCGIPWMLAFALRADGWYLRQDIIWAKPNPMPESVTDRCTKSHEYIFLLTKSERYFYDAEAIKEKAIEGADLGLLRGRIPEASGHVAWHTQSILNRQESGVDSRTAGNGTRNKRSVWNVATFPFPEAHFATFPPALIEPCILAGTSEKGCCAKCGAPWERITESETRFESGSGKAGNPPQGKNGSDYEQALSGDYDIRMGPVKQTRTVGWQPTCKCGTADIKPCTVLDPFSGSGTTGLVALRYHRNFIGIELNPEYAAMGQRRIVNDAPMFNKLELSEQS